MFYLDPTYNELYYKPKYCNTLHSLGYTSSAMYLSLMNISLIDLYSGQLAIQNSTNLLVLCHSIIKTNTASSNRCIRLFNLVL